MNLKSPFFRASSGDLRAFRLPVAAIPQHHRATAILTLWNRAFEVAIVERVILDLDLDLDRETLVVRIEMFLQEVTSPAALDAVFPVAEGWEHCISGQFAEAEGQTIAPVCTKSGMIAIKPTTATRVQYPAVALRPNSELKIISAADYKPLDVTFDDNGTIRRIRWGLDITIQSPAGSTLRVLNVHLKSGCFDDFISFRLWNTDPSTGEPASRACDTLGQQMYPLRKWIEARETAGEAWMIVGDFNRRLDAQPGAIPDEVWIALSGYNADKTGHDRDPRSDIKLFRQPYENMSTCWREFRQPNPSGNPDTYNILPIEFFIYGTRTATMIVPESEKQFPWPNPTPADKMRLSDHCPSSLTISMGSEHRP